MPGLVLGMSSDAVPAYGAGRPRQEAVNTPMRPSVTEVSSAEKLGHGSGAGRSGELEGTGKEALLGKRHRSLPLKGLGEGVPGWSRRKCAVAEAGTTWMRTKNRQCR